MPDPVTIFLVISLTLHGQEVEHNEPMPSLTACWTQARIMMAEAVTVPNEDREERVFRVGCFAHITPTPPT